MLWYVILWCIVATPSRDGEICGDSFMESIESGNVMAKHRNLVG